MYVTTVFRKKKNFPDLPYGIILGYETRNKQFFKTGLNCSAYLIPKNLLPAQVMGEYRGGSRISEKGGAQPPGKGS